MKTACIVLPTYNEAKNITRLLDAIFKEIKTIKKWTFHVLVVDDKSPDGTAELVKKAQKKHKNIHLLLGDKAGLGVAYIRGFKHAMKTIKPDAVFEMDADFSHPVDLLKKFLKKIEEGATFVIGSRYIKGGATPDWTLDRKIISTGGNIFARLVAGLYNVHDCTSGYRCISTTLLKKIDLDSLGATGYSFQMNLLFFAKQAGAKIAEIPLIFPDRKEGESKLRKKDITEFFANSFWLRYKLWEKMIKFGLVGLSGIIVNEGLLWLITAVTPLHYKTASIIAIGTAIIWNFFGNEHWTFKNHKKTNKKISRFITFALISVIGGVINWAVLVALVERASMHHLYGNLIGIVGAFFWNYLMNRLITWKR